MDDARARIPVVVRMLMKAKGVTGTEVAAALEMSASSFYARLNGVHQISASELAALATYFDVTPSLFYDPPAWVIPPPERPRRRPRGQDRRERACHTEVDALVPAA